MCNSHQDTVIVAGHICLDIIPKITYDSNLESLFRPGNLSQVGALAFHTGGSVANTGIALSKLGFKVKMVANIGDDITGDIILDILNTQDPSLSEFIIKKKGEITSYSVVLSPPNVDRIFLHNPGANHGFSSVDIPANIKGKWFHFGYPPLMRKMYEKNGKELVNIFKYAKSNGFITSLDMAMPDKDALKSEYNWKEILKNTLKYVDVFLPSLEEIMILLGTEKPATLQKLSFSFDLLRQIADELLDYGCPIIVLKLGEYGIYLKTGPNIPSSFTQNKWENIELYAPAFKTEICGTTGAGDATIAGFIAGALRYEDPEDVMNAAIATGAYSISKEDATSGIPDWSRIEEKIVKPFNRLLLVKPEDSWFYLDKKGIWRKKL
jgi:sugar/nucleoside kinase (ribokinase family)